jgi:hypothetical protein
VLCFGDSLERTRRRCFEQRRRLDDVALLRRERRKASRDPLFQFVKQLAQCTPRMGELHADRGLNASMSSGSARNNV